MVILPMLLGAFRPPKPDNRMCRDTHLWLLVHLFMHCNHLYPQICEPLRSIVLS